MAKTRFGCDLRVIAALVLLGTIMIAGVRYSAGAVEDLLLEQEVGQTGQDWADHLVRHTPRLNEQLAAGALPDDTLTRLRALPLIAPIVSFAIFDRQNRALFVSANYAGPTRPHQWGRFARKSPQVELQRQTDPAGGALVQGTAAVPIGRSGAMIGRIIVRVDETDRAGALNRGLKLMAGLAAALVVVALGAPGWLLMERHRTHARIAFLAGHDAVTELCNRAEFRARLQRVLHEAIPERHPVAVIVIGIDRFKSINDTLGHKVGDMVLKEAARRCAASMRDSDIAGRVGGDEIAIVLTGWRTSDDLTAFARRTRDALASPMEIDGYYLSLDVSTGIALARSVENAETLMKNAIVALNWAKAERTGSIRLFDQDMDATLSSRMTLTLGLRHALDLKQFELYYQPQVDLRTGAIVGCEALVRWCHPELGLVSPERFIPIAESNGTIFALGEWILRTACAEAARWPLPVTVAVNLSPLQFRDGALTTLVGDVLQASSLPANRLELEVTEGLLLSDADSLHRTLQRLRDMGISLAMDDFGKGYSSLGYLSRYPFTKLKIDRSFVRNLAGDRSGPLIIQSIIRLGQALEMTVTAEGIETEAQADLLRAHDCDFGQGYLFAKPMPVAALRRHVAGENRPRNRTGLHVA